MKYIQLALDNKAAATNMLYTYACSDDDVRVGDVLQVPFGSGNRTRTAVVFRVSDAAGYDESRIKTVSGKGTPLLTEEDVHLCEVMKRRYLCRYVDAIRCFVPSGYKKLQDQLRITDPEQAKAFLENPKSPRRQRELIDILLRQGPALKSDLKRHFGIDYSVMAAAEKKGLVYRGTVEKRRNPYKAVLPDRERFNGLTEEQEAAFTEIRAAIQKGVYRGFLIHGVTGSGKTRLYMEAVREALMKGKTAIVLVPEISLTIQAIEKFRGEFDPDLVAVLHSRLSEGERYDEWERIRRGEARIVLGARSAVFAPVKDLGVIVVDEEHESSYKADNPPKYDTREMAEERARYNDAVLIMGSATPSVVNYYRSETGELKRLELKKRYNEVLLPQVEVADMRRELQQGNKSVFSVALFRQIRESLDEKRQVILFLNRRGYASFVSCRNCGFVMTCPECGLSLTYHKSEKAAVCHYCGRKFRVPEICPECKSPYIKEFGTGTEKIEELTRKLFPEAKVDRLDLDTTRQKGSAERILGAFKAHQTDILIGTQLVAKGLDYDNVHLVGILAADISLHIPDHRAPETTFQLITQAGGRAGRGDRRGSVVVQTYSPEHYAVQWAVRGDYRQFYENEIRIRRAMHYPPFGNVIVLSFLHEEEEKARQCGEDFARELQRTHPELSGEDLLGPRPTHIPKIRGRYRYQVLIKYMDREMEDFLEELDGLRMRFAAERHRDVSVGIDINPYSMT